MIDQIDGRLLEWIKTILQNAEVSLGPPGGSTAARTVGLYLLELTQTPPPARSRRRPPIQINLRYLVTTHAAETKEAHQMLGDLLVAALKDPEFEVEQEPLPISLWTALKIAPQPSFVLRVPFNVERPEKIAPPVLRPLIVKSSALRSLSGQVLGPKDIPIMDARVELPALQLHTNTDSKGRFHFSTVPAEPHPKFLRVRAKGREYSINTEHAASTGEPLVIHLQLEG
jgi:uncharacterized protein DUF4255